MKNQQSKSWRVRVISFLCWLLPCLTNSYNSAFAQSNIVPDNTLGAESSVVVPLDPDLPVDSISGGAIRGTNLFHSFKEFNISEGRGAYFFSPNADIQNILARVTGKNPSSILGTIGTFGSSNPNLFLINPNGIIFGRNASLDMGNVGLEIGGTGGSFVATTANAILMGNRGIFSASSPTESNLLSINPSAFFFNAVSGQAILNQSTARESVLGFDVNGLQVPNGRSLLLVSGNTKLDGGLLTALGGRVELAGVETGTVELNVDNNILSLLFPDSVSKTDVSIANKAKIFVFDEVGGSIAVNARNLELLESELQGGNSGGLGSIDSQAGNIEINATGTVNLESSFIENGVGFQASGGGGDIIITTDSLFASGLNQVSTGTWGQGNAGEVVIKARNTVSLDGFLNGIFSNLQFNAVGNGGDINISTGSLFLRNGAQLAAGVNTGQGNAGNINIFARDIVWFDGIRGDTHSGITTSLGGESIPGQRASGKSGNINITTGSLLVTNGAQLQTLTSAKGDAGNVTINARDIVWFDGESSSGSSSGIWTTVEPTANGNAGNISISTGYLAVTRGAQLLAITRGEGNAGNVAINARDAVILDGVRSDGLPSLIATTVDKATTVGDGGNIAIAAGSLFVTDGAELQTLTVGQGNAGNINIVSRDTVSFDGGNAISGAGITSTGNGGSINISSKTLSLTNDSKLFAGSLGQGMAGNIDINIRNILQANNGQILTRSIRSAGGDINITAKDIRLRNNSDIRTDLSRGQQSGGNITLSADTIVALEDSDILAFAPEGKGGNITFNTRAFISEPFYRPTPPTIDGATLNALDGNDRVDVNASGAINSGNILIPDTTPVQNSLTELPSNLVDTNALIANSCIARNNQRSGNFFITGSGGLPVRPGDVKISPYPTRTVWIVPDESEQRKPPSSLVPDQPIVEAQGIYRLDNGQIILGKSCN